MGSRGYQRLFRRARAEIRRRRREAMIGACIDVTAHLMSLIATSAEREAARRMWPGLDGLYDPRPPRWPEPLDALFPQREMYDSRLYVGTIGGRARTNPLLRIAPQVAVIDRDPTAGDRLAQFWRDRRR